MKNIKSNALTELQNYFNKEAAQFSGKTAWLFASPEKEIKYFGKYEDEEVVSASTIKIAIMMALFTKLQKENSSVLKKIPVSSTQILNDSLVFKNQNCEISLYELVVWMMVNSDNSATNIILNYLGFDYINSYCKKIGLTHTRVERLMLDFKAVEEGRNNYISPLDFYHCIQYLWKDRETDSYAAMALDILKRNRDFTSLCRYLYEGPEVAHKSGGLDTIAHDAGLFFTENSTYFLGVFISEYQPSHEMEVKAQQLIGRLSRKVYEYETGKGISIYD